MDILINAIKTNSSITTLRVDSCENVGNLSMSIGALIKYSITITNLTINSYFNEDIKEFAKCLQANQTIDTLNVMPVSNKQITPILKALAKNSTIRKIKFGFGCMNKDILNKLISVIEHSKSLVDIELTTPNMDNENEAQKGSSKEQRSE